MIHKIQAFALILAAAACVSCGTARKTAEEKVSAAKSFPAVNQKGKTAIVAHRGFWKCEAAGFSENSIASLKAAQDAGLWGSECDVQLTADGIVIVNHNNDINGKLIRDHNFIDFASDLLPNGERRPTLDEYLAQAEKSSGTVLIIEFKKQKTSEAEDELIEKTLQTMKSHGLYNPDRIGFISFSLHICEVLARKCPEFINQFLTSNKLADENPSVYSAKGINGVDYEYGLFHAHPEWVGVAKNLGMSVNVWTVNKEDRMREMIDLGVHAVTTNEPLKVREILGKNEFRK